MKNKIQLFKNKSSKGFLTGFIAVLLLLTILFSYFTTRQPFNTVSIDNHYFKIEVAKTDQQKETGLAKYKKINNDFGMYFLFDSPDYYAFWMKNMKFPIDIIYIYKDRIVDIFTNVKNPKDDLEQLKIYKPKSIADSVLEINAGLSIKYNFKIGDSVKINIK